MKSNFSDLLKRANEAEAERWAELPPIKRDFYTLHPDIDALTQDQVDQFRVEKKNITVEDVEGAYSEIPKPISTFQQAFANYPEVMEEIRKQGFTEPSPIQAQMWPICLQGYDTIGIAQTGTGKTLAYLLPALIHIDEQPTPRSERKGPSCLILTPTRELALQIESEVRKYHYRGIRSAEWCPAECRRVSRRCPSALRNHQHPSHRPRSSRARLHRYVDICNLGVEIVIATPGRLTDLVLDRVLDLSSVTYLVLDEADRMLDMGFEPQIKKILCDVRPDRHSVMTSATWPSLVRELAAKYTKNPFLIVVGTLDLTVTQEIRFVTDQEKRSVLVDFISSLGPDEKALIFVGRKGTADDVCSDLSRCGVRLGSLHGDRDQGDRERALAEIRDGTSKLLVATDVASRGLDIPGITHVFNYDFPRDIEDYVHRVGRTGRAGKFGKSVTLMTRYDWHHAPSLHDIMVEASQTCGGSGVFEEVPEELVRMKANYERKSAQPGFRGRPSRFAPRPGGPPPEEKWGNQAQKGGSGSRPPPDAPNAGFVNPNRRPPVEGVASMSIGGKGDFTGHGRY